MTHTSGYLRWFNDLRLEDVPLVGGKNASQGELYQQLRGQGIRVPNGFALTANAYRDSLTAAGSWAGLHALLDDLDVTDAFAAVFDGFSIGSNDLTQLTLGVDRDFEIVSFDFDERDPGMLEMLRLAIVGARRNGRKVGICGEAPANYPEITRFLTELGIDFISVNPSSLLRTIEIVQEAEGSMPTSIPTKPVEMQILDGIVVTCHHQSSR